MWILVRCLSSGINTAAIAFWHWHISQDVYTAELSGDRKAILAKIEE
ncbi:MAG TPA: hypothetical protein V6D30_20990 [Leptolyngbyaceae cyanobacterium]